MRAVRPGAYSVLFRAPVVRSPDVGPTLAITWTPTTSRMNLEIGKVPLHLLNGFHEVVLVHLT